MDVKDMDYQSYPQLDSEGNIISRYWRIFYETPDGFLKWETVVYPSDQEVSEIQPYDILNFENKVKRPVKEVRIGLTHLQQEPNGPWLSQEKLKGENIPPSRDEYAPSFKKRDFSRPEANAWVELDYTDLWYDKWRPKAYEGRRDYYLFINKPKRRITKEEEMAKRIQDLETRLKKTEEEKKNYLETLNRQSQGQNVGA